MCAYSVGYTDRIAWHKQMEAWTTFKVRGDVIPYSRSNRWSIFEGQLHVSMGSSSICRRLTTDRRGAVSADHVRTWCD